MVPEPLKVLGRHVVRILHLIELIIGKLTGNKSIKSYWNLNTPMKFYSKSVIFRFLICFNEPENLRFGAHCLKSVMEDM